jgi:CheY-like chemotaxis protein
MRRVLVVEDDKAIAYIIRAVLEASGHEVCVAHNGDAAVEVAGQSDKLFDLLLCDLVIPGLPATQIVRALRESNPKLRVVIMTGHSPENIGNYEITGAYCVLLKPFSIWKPIECLACSEEVQSCDITRNDPKPNARTSGDTSLGTHGRWT